MGPNLEGHWSGVTGHGSGLGAWCAGFGVRGHVLWDDNLPKLSEPSSASPPSIFSVDMLGLLQKSVILESGKGRGLSDMEIPRTHHITFVRLKVKGLCKSLMFNV
jgi:hypothetical protein